MTKKLKRIITMLLVITCLVIIFTGCLSNSNKENEDKTNKMQEDNDIYDTTSTYTLFGEFEIYEQYADYFNDLLIKKGTVLVMNDIIPDDDTIRGNKSLVLLDTLMMNYTDFVEKYLTLGATDAIIPYEDNYYIEYTGNEKLIFKFSYKDEEEKVVHFNIYKINN